MALYKGFSTISDTKNFRLSDFDLVKQDLINHFNIRKGEKLMNPDYGTVIWDTIFEPFDDRTKRIVQDDISKLVRSDPRIGVRNAVITEYEHGLQIELDLVMVQTNQVDTLRLQFDKNSRGSTRIL